jgi:N-acetylglucosaminyl-diphospho-decaprenol L-rhamnosyltransferase
MTERAAETITSPTSSSTLTCTVIVVNYNGSHLVLECLDSIVGSDTGGLEVEVVVVDNASVDGSDLEIQRRFPSVRLIRSPVNLGFGGGVNLGIRESTGDIVILINNDARARPGFVRALAEPFLSEGDRLGAVTARIQLTGRFVTVVEAEADYVDGAGRGWRRLPESAEGGVELMNSTGGQISDSGNGSDRSWLLPVGEGPLPDESVFGFCGGGAAIRRAALDEVGLFDETLFMYYEDTDLSWRLRRFGWRIQYADGARTVHHHAASSGTTSRLFLVNNIRNRMLVAIRNAPAAIARRAVLRTVLSLVRSTVRGFRPGGASVDRRRAHATAVALAQTLLRLPAYLRSRRVVEENAVLDRSFVLDWTVRD